MPNVGDIEYKYGRVYIYTNPNPAQGPGTWRVSNPDELAGPGGGGGGTGVTYDFDGEQPIEIGMVPGVGTNPTVVTTSININDLPSDDEI